jgi:hypothetical protein
MTTIPISAEATDSVDGERKTVTALFADIKGSMELIEDLDPEEARAIIDPTLKLMIDAVRRYDGYVVQSTQRAPRLVFALHWTSLVRRRPDGGNCARRPAWRGCCAIPIATTKRAPYSRKSTTGSPKASICPT